VKTARTNRALAGMLWIVLPERSCAGSASSACQIYEAGEAMHPDMTFSSDCNSRKRLRLWNVAAGCTARARRLREAHRADILCIRAEARRIEGR